MCSSSIAAKLFHVFLSAWTLFPRGHHCALPRPRTSVPTNSSPVRISMVIEFRLLSLVSSTELGRFAITRVRFTRRRLGHAGIVSQRCAPIMETACETACPATTRSSSTSRCWLVYCFFAGDARGATMGFGAAGGAAGRAAAGAADRVGAAAAPGVAVNTVLSYRSIISLVMSTELEA